MQKRNAGWMRNSGFRPNAGCGRGMRRSEEHTSELQSRQYLVCRLLLEKMSIAELDRILAQQFPMVPPGMPGETRMTGCEWGGVLAGPIGLLSLFFFVSGRQPRGAPPLPPGPPHV